MKVSVKFNPTAGVINVIDRVRGCLLIIFAVLCICGCGDFFASKPTELEARAILNDISRIRENPHTQNTLPEIYKAPAKKIAVKDGIKLFYFSKHHPTKELTTLVTQQLGCKVSGNTATNQLIIHCRDDAEADKVLEFLELADVPPIQVNIDCLILERFGDVTMDWEASILIENFLGEGITFGEARGTFQTDATKGTIGELLSLSPAFPGASLREGKRATFGLDFGYWIDKGVPGHQIRAVVDMLESYGYLKILLNPTLETVNGKKATVMIRDFAPLEQTVTTQTEILPYNVTKYQWVEDTLTVTPYVYADGSIGLTTSIKIGSKSKPEGVVQASIITERSIDVAENRIEPGKSMVIGGMRKSEKRSVIRGVPFFKDIPLLGILFSSKDFEEKATEIIFILTPSISSGGIPYAEMAEDIRKKHAAPEYKGGLQGVITDPLGTGLYTEHIERTAEIEVAEAGREVAEIKDRLAMAEELAKLEKLRAQKAEADAKASKAVAKKANAHAHAAKVAADKATKKADTATKQAATEKARAQKAVQETARLKAQLQKSEEAKSQAPKPAPAKPKPAPTKPKPAPTEQPTSPAPAK